MRITVREKTMVQPIEKTPHQILWTSNLDQLYNFHTLSIYVYRPNGTTDFFSSTVLKHALSKVLVSFFPYAGRLIMNKEGRLEIDCSDEGVLFVEAETDSVLDDLGDFAPTEDLQLLTPTVDKSNGISSYPLFSLQVTYFKCGGVSLGVLAEHSVADGTGRIHCINSWSKVARGLDIETSPFLDRSLLLSREPPTSSFPHTELHAPPTMKQYSSALEPKASPNSYDVAMFKFSSHQVKLLKAQCNGASDVRISTFKVIAAHVWRCVCKARCLEDDQEIRLTVFVDSRPRLIPPLPGEYFGNAVYFITLTSKAGEMLSNPLVDTVRDIHGSLQRADDAYLRSAIDYMEVKPGNLNKFVCPNFGFNSWCQMPVYDADFGWGKPIFMGLGTLPCESLGYLLPSPIMDGSFSVVISLQPDQMVQFKKYVHDI